jgi:hypothetical protein
VPDPESHESTGGEPCSDDPSDWPPHGTINDHNLGTKERRCPGAREAEEEEDRRVEDIQEEVDYQEEASGLTAQKFKVRAVVDD